MRLVRLIRFRLGHVERLRILGPVVEVAVGIAGRNARITTNSINHALGRVAKLADAQDLKSCVP